MKVYEYRPMWVHYFEPSEFEIKEPKDLLELEFVKIWTKDEDFSSIKISTGSIMVIRDEGKKWNVIGTCNNTVAKVLTDYFGEWVANAP